MLRIVAGSFLISGDVAQAPIAGGGALFDGARVVAVGTAAELQARFPDARVEAHHAVLLPGLVNAHTHLELSALHGRVPGGAGFVPWVTRLMTERERPAFIDNDEALDAAISGLLGAGTVAIGEVTNTLLAAPRLVDTGLRGVVFHEVYGLRREVADVMLGMAERARAELSAWPSGFRYALAPHTPYSVHPSLLRALVDRARERKERTSLHLCEHPAERAFLRDGSGPFAGFLAARGADAADWSPPGLDPIRYVRELGLLGPELLCVHLADARPDEIALVAEAGARVVLCPRSNLHIEVRLPPLLELLHAGVRPALGTDSLASNASLDVLDEAKALHARFPSVAPRVLLAMATSFGAEALGLADELGTLREGLAPGVLAFEHAGAAPTDPERFVLSGRVSARRVLIGAQDSASIVS